MVCCFPSHGVFPQKKKEKTGGSPNPSPKFLSERICGMWFFPRVLGGEHLVKEIPKWGDLLILFGCRRESFPPWVLAGWLQYFGSLLSLLYAREMCIILRWKDTTWFLLTSSKHKETHSWPEKRREKCNEERFGVFMYIYIPDSLGAFKNCKVSPLQSPNKCKSPFWKYPGHVEASPPFP